MQATTKQSVPVIPSPTPRSTERKSVSLNSKPLPLDTAALHFVGGGFSSPRSNW